MSRENDTPETDEPRPECLSMAKAIEGDGPIALTTREADALRSAITMMLKELTELRGLNTAMALGLYRKRLQVVHHEHDDGTVSFDLQPAPPDDAPGAVH